MDFDKVSGRRLLFKYGAGFFAGTHASLTNKKNRILIRAYIISD